MSGPLETDAWVVPSMGSRLELRKITLPALTSSQVEVEIIMCGLCHTDIHMRDNDWGISDYPLVLGHEGVGIVRAVGSEVTQLKVGDRVAIAWIRDSCRSCRNCSVGRENICLGGYQGTYLGSHAGLWGKAPANDNGGCFSKVMRIEDRFALPIPHSVPSEVACPLLCGGGTVFEPICDFAPPGSRVGVVGIGGLGTAAMKLAKLKGCHVTAISSSPEKKLGALSSGADLFINSGDHSEMEALKQTPLDLIIDTTPTIIHPVSFFMDLLVFNGVYCRVGIPPLSSTTFDYDFIPLIFSQKKIVGSIVTGTKRLAEMLDLTAANASFMSSNDHWKTQPMNMSEVNEAMEALQSRTNAGFRIVLLW